MVPGFLCPYNNCNFVAIIFFAVYVANLSLQLQTIFHEKNKTMQKEEFVQTLRTLATLYNEVYLLSTYKSEIIFHKECKVSIKLESDSLISNFPLFENQRMLLINFLTELIFAKISQIRLLETQIQNFL